MPDPEYTRDFFIHHADDDVAWAEWIAFELEKAGYGVTLTAWDIRPGHNRLEEIDKALSTSRHTLHLLSSEQDAEVLVRTAAQHQGLQGKERALIPIRLRDGEVPGSVGALLPIDLSDADEDEARRRLLSGLESQTERVARAGFPGRPTKVVRFPGAEQEVWELRGHRSDPRFTGRDELLADLRRDFRASDPASGIQAITGLGGLGKTQVAIEYAFRHGGSYDLIWWIRAEDPATLRGDYVELAKELGLPSDTDDQAIATLRQSLRRRKNWLLIFDNAEDPEELLPLLPEKLTGHVLVTSRRPEWPHTRTRHLEVLSTTAAMEYLSQWGRVSNPDMAKELAEALGYLPLALAQAASVIADGMSAAEYLDHLRKESPALFAEGRAGNHQETVASTWRVSFDRLADRSPAAVALFRLAAFLGAEAIPLDQIVSVAGMPAELTEVLENPFKRVATTKALGEYSLAKTGDGLMSIHRIVQAVTRAELDADQPRWAEVALNAMSATFPSEVATPISWPACEKMLAHALSSAGHAQRLKADIATTADLLDRIAHYLLARGRLERAAAVVEDALTAVRQLPVDTLAYLRCRNTQGLILLSRGDYQGARQAQEEVYRARIQKLGTRNVETLRAGRDFVEALYKQGHWAQATKVQNELVDAFTAVLGAEDLETITALAYQATLVRAGGQYQEARALEERVVEVRSRLLGDGHTDTLTAKANLATTLHALGEFRKARAMEERVLTASQRILGDEHPHTLTAKANLATTFRSLGEFRRARTIQEHVLTASQRILGDEHPHTLNANSNLAATLHALGELREARTIIEHVVTARQRILGDEHPDTLAAKAHLASTFHASREFRQARAIQEHVLTARQRILGDEHPDTLNASANLAATLHASGDSQEARALLEHVITARQRSLGDEHPDTLNAIAQLASTLHALEEASHARQLLRDALDISLRAHGKKNPLTSKMAMELASIFASPHEANARTAIIVQHLSWLSKEPPSNLSGEQKSIKERIKGLLFGGGKPAKRRPPKGRR